MLEIEVQEFFKKGSATSCSHFSSCHSGLQAYGPVASSARVSIF